MTIGGMNKINRREEKTAVELMEMPAEAGALIEKKIVSEQIDSLENARWLTSSEAAQYLRISMSSIKTMIYRGQIRVHKLGRRNRFLREELERLIVLPTMARR